LILWIIKASSCTGRLAISFNALRNFSIRINTVIRAGLIGISKIAVNTFKGAIIHVSNWALNKKGTTSSNTGAILRIIRASRSTRTIAIFFYALE